MPLPKLLGGLFNELRAKEGMNDGIKIGPNLSYYQTTFRMTSLLIYEYRYLANYSHITKPFFERNILLQKYLIIIEN